MRRFSRSLTLLFVISIASSVRAEPAATRQPANLPAEGVFDEGWFIIQMQGQHCGHMHSLMRRIGDEIKTETSILIELSRAETEIRTSELFSFRRTP